jgi:hypothetical protein
MSHVKHRVGCFYISTFRSVCVVPDMAVFCSSLMQCFSNWVPRRGLKDSERRKFVMAEEFYLRSKICTSVNERSVLITRFLNVILSKNTVH